MYLTAFIMIRMNNESLVGAAHEDAIQAEGFSQSYERRNKNMVPATTETDSDP